MHSFKTNQAKFITKAFTEVTLRHENLSLILFLDQNMSNARLTEKFNIVILKAMSEHINMISKYLTTDGILLTPYTKSLF